MICDMRLDLCWQITNHVSGQARSSTFYNRYLSWIRPAAAPSAEWRFSVSLVRASSAAASAIAHLFSMDSRNDTRGVKFLWIGMSVFWWVAYTGHLTAQS